MWHCMAIIQHGDEGRIDKEIAQASEYSCSVLSHDELLQHRLVSRLYLLTLIIGAIYARRAGRLLSKDDLPLLVWPQQLNHPHQPQGRVLLTQAEAAQMASVNERGPHQLAREPSPAIWV
jgi:hypothetical protein